MVDIYTKLKCEDCNNYIWSETSTDKVVCACGSSEINGANILRNNNPGDINEQDFESAVNNVHRDENITINYI